MRELVCIVCPIGCSLVVEEGGGEGSEDRSVPDKSRSVPIKEGSVPVEGRSVPLTITGNRCPRGAAYAQEEISAPKRVVTATCGIRGLLREGQTPEGQTLGGQTRSLTAPRRIPVKSSAPCPKENISELLDDIYSLKVNLPVKVGEKLISDWKGSGIDVVAVRSLE